jgi:large subunit ribosomal protein L21e
MKGSEGYRRRTRSLRVKPRDRGKVRIRARMQRFGEQERVSLKINPFYQNIPHPRFNGRTGTVVGRQGRAYFVEIVDGGKTKRIIVTPEHLKRVG